MSFVTSINTAISSGIKEYVIAEGKYEAGKAFVFAENVDDLTLDFTNAKITSEGCFLEIRNSKRVTVKNLSLTAEKKSDFAVKILSSSVVFEGCDIRSDTAGMSISESKAEIINSSFSSDREGNGICVYSDSEVSVKLCNFELCKGEAITVVDNNYGMVSVIESAFKKCYAGIRSSGRNQIKINNNYFMTASCSIGVYPSLLRSGNEGASLITIAYNMFDEIPNVGKTVIEIEGAGKEYVHNEIKIMDNLFLPKTRSAILARGVKTLSFKNNDVRTNVESNVEHCIINGIKA